MGIVEDFHSHVVWEQLNTSKELLKNSTGLSAEVRFRTARILNDMESRKEKCDPCMFSSSTLNNTNNNLRQLTNYIQNGNNNGVSQYVDIILDELAGKWPAISGRYQAFVSEKTANDVIEATEVHISKVDNSVTAIGEAQEKIRSLSNEYSTAVKSAVDSLDIRIGEIVSHYDENLKNGLIAKTEEANTVIEAKSDQADKILQHIENIESAVTKKSNIISGKIIADKYGKYARNKSILAYVYDAVAISFALAGLIVLWLTLTSIDMNETSTSVMKLAITLATLTASGYIFRRGTLQHKEAIAAKRTDLTIKQYLPFISVLDETNRNEITVEIARRIFVKGEISDEKSSFSSLFGKKGSSLDDESIARILEIMNRFTKSSSE